MTRARILMGLSGTGLSVAALPALAAVLQDVPRTTRIDQIPPQAQPVEPEPPLAAPDVRPPTQLSRSGERVPPTQVPGTPGKRGPVPQISHEPRSANAAPQLYVGGPTAQPAAPLSSPTQSKPAAVVRLDGKDRCDPAGAGNAAEGACRRVIETRAGEFTRPNPLTLSPEQRLMVDQRLRQLPTSAESAVQRIGRNDVDAGDADAQNVASLVLARPQPVGPAPERETPAAGLDATVLEVIQALAGATPTLPTVTPP